MLEVWHISLLFDCQVPQRNSLKISVVFSLFTVLTTLPANLTKFKKSFSILELLELWKVLWNFYKGETSHIFISRCSWQLLCSMKIVLQCIFPFVFLHIVYLVQCCRNMWSLMIFHIKRAYEKISSVWQQFILQLLEQKESVWIVYKTA